MMMMMTTASSSEKLQCTNYSIQRLKDVINETTEDVYKDVKQVNTVNYVLLDTTQITTNRFTICTSALSIAFIKPFCKNVINYYYKTLNIFNATIKRFVQRQRNDQE
jgi:hypothetical protein